MERKRQTPRRRGQELVQKQREQARTESKAREKGNQKKGANKDGGDKKGGDKQGNKNRKKGKRAQPLGLASIAAIWPGVVSPEARREKSGGAVVPPNDREQEAEPLSQSAYGAEPAPPAPRVLPFIVVKRDSPRFRDHYGHWWFEIDRVESYGWWADHCPFTLRDMIVGTRGTLNGVGGTCLGGTPTSDPRHGEESDHSFSPTLVVPKTDCQVRQEIRAFARSYRGAWGWQWWWSKERMTDCHTFQDDLFEAIGLEEGLDHVYTRGPGCPFMYPFRHAAWRLQDGLAALRRWRHGLCCG